MAGIVETVQLLEGIKKLAVAGKGVAADGKIDIADLQVLFGMIKDIQVIIEAIKGVQNVPSEVKDLDGAEASLLLAKVLEIANELRK